MNFLACMETFLCRSHSRYDRMEASTDLSVTASQNIIFDCILHIHCLGLGQKPPGQKPPDKKPPNNDEK